MTPSTRLAAIELGCTIALPLLVLQFGGSWLELGPVGVAVAAALPPAGFLLAQFARERSVGALGVVSLIGVLLTGGVAVLQLDGAWFAVKEGLLPVLLGGLTAASAFSPWPVIGVVFDRLLAPDALASIRAAPESAARFQAAVRRSTIELGVASALPGVLAFGVARSVVTSAGGTEAYVQELGRYTMWSFPLVTVPALAVTVIALRRAMAHVEQALGVGFDTLLPEIE